MLVPGYGQRKDARAARRTADAFSHIGAGGPRLAGERSTIVPSPAGAHVDSTFDLLTLALLPAVPPRAVREILLRGPLAEALESPRLHADLLGSAALAALRSGAARLAAE